ncbi:MAG: alpha/beta hydrolase [Bulleidia sp.]|nr:alpha/beta hydrolase [Bulleidia sp.]
MNWKNTLQEPDYEDKTLPYYDELILVVKGSRVFGEVYVPGGIYEKPRPCVCMFHGIPGTAVNDDLAQDFRRAGCVVIRIFHRGAWGSEGEYSFSHCIEDAVETARYAVSEEAVSKYHIDPENVFIFGHSNGGNTVINAMKDLPFIKGAAAIAPYDHAPAWKRQDTAFLNELIYGEAKFLHTDPDALWKDSGEHWRKWEFTNAAETLKDRNFLIIGGTVDAVAQPELMVEPLWEKLDAQGTFVNHRKILYHAGHGFDNCRMQLAEDVTRWIEEVSET